MHRENRWYVLIEDSEHKDYRQGFYEQKKGNLGTLSNGSDKHAGIMGTAAEFFGTMIPPNLKSGRLWR